MVVLDDAKENFILNVPFGEDVETKLREEERKRTGRYLAVSVVLFLVAIGLYHAISYGSTKMSALLGAALIMFLYLLWLLYAAQRKKTLHTENRSVDKPVSTVLLNMNNMKGISNSYGPHDNYMFTESEDDEIQKLPIKTEHKMSSEFMEKRQNNKEKVLDVYKDEILEKEKKENVEHSSRKSSKSSEIFIRTYSIA